MCAPGSGEVKSGPHRGHLEKIQAQDFNFAVPLGLFFRSLAGVPTAATLANLSRCSPSVDAGLYEGIRPMLVPKTSLERLAAAIFQAAGSTPAEAAAVGEHLVEANLVGHDSHGVIRIAPYINWVARRNWFPIESHDGHNAGSIGVLDGQLGYGQVMARHATELAIRLAKEHAIAAVALFNSGHVGRVAPGPTWPPKRASSRSAS